jgi:hypothetical protein
VLLHCAWFRATHWRNVIRVRWRARGEVVAGLTTIVVAVL